MMLTLEEIARGSTPDFRPQTFMYRCTAKSRVVPATNDHDWLETPKSASASAAYEGYGARSVVPICRVDLLRRKVAAVNHRSSSSCMSCMPSEPRYSGVIDWSTCVAAGTVGQRDGKIKLGAGAA